VSDIHKDLLEAADRYISFVPANDEIRGEREAEERLMSAVAAVRAQSKSDALPASDPDWLRSIGFSGISTLHIFVCDDWECDHSVFVCWNSREGFSYGGGSTGSPLPFRNDATRGDILRLLDALKLNSASVAENVQKGA
jgi:hypothetical protein